MKAQSFLSEPHFLHFLPSLSSHPHSLSLCLTAEQLGRLTAQRSAQRSSPLASPQINFLLANRSSPRPLLSHLSHTHPHGRAHFFSDFSAAPEMLICIVESDGQGKRLQPCRFLCLLSLLTVSVCVAGAPARQQAALRRTGTHTLS